MADKDVINPRLVAAGDKIVPKGYRTPEVVRSVSVILHMANGVDVVYEDGEEVRKSSEKDLTPTEEQVLETHKRAVEATEAAAKAEEKRAEELAKLEERRQEAIRRQQEISEASAASEGE